MAPTKKLVFDEQTLQILRELVWTEDGLTAKIVQQLDRPTYDKVNKALFAMNGVWKSGKIKAHVFEEDPRPLVEGLLQAGSLTVERDGFFETPENIVRKMIDLAEIGKNDSVLEPSAGKGAIAKFLRVKSASVLCIEKNEKRAEFLRLEGYDCLTDDFLEYDRALTCPFKRIVMNPPFENSQDVDHLYHAYNLLSKKGGRLVAIMGEHAFFAEDAKSVEFREWLKKVHGTSEKLPEGSFKSSGTGVNTRLVVIERKR